MNCKSGDLAYIVGSHKHPDSQHLGKIVRCITLVQRFPAAWEVEPKIPGYRGIYDKSLRPIGNPGEFEFDSRDVLVRPPVLV